MKKALFIVLAIIFFAIIGNYNSENNNANVGNTNAYQQQVLGESIEQDLAIPEKTFVDVKTDSSSITNPVVSEKEKNTNINVAKPLEPIKYYENSQGNTVQSPTLYDAIPAGATAKCGDGTYSFSQSRRGTCSHHGGVSVWY